MRSIRPRDGVHIDELAVARDVEAVRGDFALQVALQGREDAREHDARKERGERRPGEGDAVRALARAREVVLQRFIGKIHEPHPGILGREERAAERRVAGADGDHETGEVRNPLWRVDVAVRRGVACAAIGARRVVVHVAPERLGFDAQDLGVLVLAVEGQLAGHVVPLRAIEVGVRVDGHVEGCVDEVRAVSCVEVRLAVPERGRGVAVEGHLDAVRRRVASAARARRRAQVIRVDHGRDTARPRLVGVDAVRGGKTGEKDLACAVLERDGQVRDEGTARDAAEAVDGRGVGPRVCIFPFLCGHRVGGSGEEDC